MVHPILGWIHEHADRGVKPLHLVEKDAILSAMILCRGKVRLAAERLGISRETLHRKLLAYRAEDDGTLF